MLSFEELTEARRSLQSFCLLHVPSLLSLQSGISFKLFPTEEDLSNEVVRHITTTATCLSSLIDCPPRFQTTEFACAEILRSTFAKRALLRQEWKSEGSAGVYCRCRALPMVISSSSGIDKEIEGHIKAILGQLEKKPGRFGIGEADPELPEVEWYPPNAFHTYWTLEILDLVKNTFQADHERLSDRAGLDLKQRREGMLLWARQQLGYQIGLHSAAPPSSVLDSDQLAWSLAIFLRFDDNLNVNLENRDYIKQAFKCLFSTQTDGTWRHYKPLFHYKEAGNAYCYVFETFAVLLGCALQEKAEADMVRELLEPYCKNLMDLWRYADSTKIPLSPDGKAVGWGWCSGHRTNVTSPESWATASVFSYAQALRRLIGIWCREEALSSLNTPRSRQSSKEAAEEIAARGKTWGANRVPVSELLWTMFINPVRMHECTDKLEPDSQPIAKKHARSAILFGPPGTSKTTLVRSLADVIDWKYVEIHASHFVAEGLTQVQKTADRIFKQLSELDHAVVLFDEIDELVRERDIEKDAFGRFLTTSMLPKLAELWDARKILYFVATNHINYFDSAIIRSHRFDALVLVSPPSFRAKVNELRKMLSEVHGLTMVDFGIEEREIQSKLEGLGNGGPAHEHLEKAREGTPQQEVTPDWKEQKLSLDSALAKFALLRWDEIDELAYRLAGALKALDPVARKISPEILKQALAQVADSEWRKNKSYLDYLRDTRSERRDYQMLNVWELKGSAEISVPGIVRANGHKWLAKAVDSLQDIEIPGFQLFFESPGHVEIRASSSK
jgi:ATPase family protein associated with various cellular activities (AAA)